jgi:hypothetical protein
MKSISEYIETALRFERRAASEPPSGSKASFEPPGRDRAEGEGEMSEPKRDLASLGLDNAIRLRWALRDIRGKRLKLTPVDPNDLRTLIDMGYVEMKDEVPTVTMAGLNEIAIGNLPSDRGGAEGEK